MEQYSENQLNAKITTFLSKKYQKYPELGAFAPVTPKNEISYIATPRMSYSLRVAQAFARTKSLIVNY